VAIHGEIFVFSANSLKDLRRFVLIETEIFKKKSSTNGEFVRSRGDRRPWIRRLILGDRTKEERTLLILRNPASEIKDASSSCGDRQLHLVEKNKKVSDFLLKPLTFTFSWSND